MKISQQINNYRQFTELLKETLLSSLPIVEAISHLNIRFHQFDIEIEKINQFRFELTYKNIDKDKIKTYIIWMS